MLMFSSPCEQQSVELDNSDEARLYMAYVVTNNGTSTWIECTGTFITQSHVLTSASCVYDRSLSQLIVWSGTVVVLLPGSGNSHFIMQRSIHPDFNLQRPMDHNIAVLGLIDPNPRLEGLQPRSLGRIEPDRFCTLLGWEGRQANRALQIPLQMLSVPVVNSSMCTHGSTTAYCTRLASLTTTISFCGGLMGAPIFCSSNRISGIVVRDGFCTSSPNPIGGSFLSLREYRDWIRQVSGGGGAGTIEPLALLLIIVTVATKLVL